MILRISLIWNYMRMHDTARLNNGLFCREVVKRSWNHYKHVCDTSTTNSGVLQMFGYQCYFTHHYGDPLPVSFKLIACPLTFLPLLLKIDEWTKRGISLTSTSSKKISTLLIFTGHTASLGGPWEVQSFIWRRAKEIVSPYTMVSQIEKILCSS